MYVRIIMQVIISNSTLIVMINKKKVTAYKNFSHIQNEDYDVYNDIIITLLYSDKSFGCQNFNLRNLLAIPFN